MNEQKLLVRIPFEGFYCSAHDQCIEDYIERDMEEYGIDWDEWMSKADMNGINITYARIYLQAFVLRLRDHGIDINLEFESITSPREYNFETDKIWAYITREDLIKLCLQLDQDAIEATIQKLFTSCDGFISFYSNDINTYMRKPLEDWDHNELFALIMTAYKCNCEVESEYVDIMYEYAENWADYIDWPYSEDWKLQEECA